MNSFKMSFWIVPLKWPCWTFASSAATMYMAMIGKTAPFMVIDTDIFSKLMPSNSCFMSSTESMATPLIPTSP